MMSASKKLEQLTGELLITHRLTVTAAESCTGGLIMHRLTNIPGSSAYIMGGIVTYSDDTKHQFLKVSQNTLKQYGAVSAQTAVEMAHGVRALFNADIGLSVTGIAGPGGATDQKPVGLTYMAISAGTP